MKLLASVGIELAAEVARDVRRVRCHRVDVHRQVIAHGRETGLEHAGQGLAVVSDDVESGLGHLRDQELLGALTAGVAGVDHPVDLGNFTFSVGPEAVGVLGPACALEDRHGALGVVGVGEDRVVAVRPRSDRAAGQRREPLSERLVDLGEHGIDVDRLRERGTEIVVCEGARTGLVGRALLELVEVQSLVLSHRPRRRSRCSGLPTQRRGRCRPAGR